MENMYLEYEGQTYRTVRIGTQIWMAENLNYEAEGSRFYENNPDNGAIYGRLYSWETAIKVCPSGWRLPTDDDWDVLYRFVESNTCYKIPCKSPAAGRHLKATSGWNDNGNGTDDYGFSALPGGFCYSFFDYCDFNFYHSENFYDVGDIGRWWSSSVSSDCYAYYHYMDNGDDSAYWSGYYKNCYLLSVRYVQDYL